MNLLDLTAPQQMDHELVRKPRKICNVTWHNPYVLLHIQENTTQIQRLSRNKYVHSAWGPNGDGQLMIMNATHKGSTPEHTLMVRPAIGNGHLRSLPTETACECEVLGLTKKIIR